MWSIAGAGEGAPDEEEAEDDHKPKRELRQRRRSCRPGAPDREACDDHRPPTGRGQWAAKCTPALAGPHAHRLGSGRTLDARRTPFTQPPQVGTLRPCSQNERNGAATDGLLLAATPVGRTDPGGGVETLPGELEGLAEALRAAGRALETSAARVVPAAEPSDRGICSRYQRAAAGWPVSPPPSYERFASTLAGLHDAAGAARLAARRCDEARRTVDVLLRTGPSVVNAVRHAASMPAGIPRFRAERLAGGWPGFAPACDVLHWTLRLRRARTHGALAN